MFSARGQGAAVVAIALWAGAQGSARSLRPNSPVSSAAVASQRVVDYRTHTVGDLRAAIANDGTFGSGSWMVPWFYGRHDFEYNPSFEFPAGSFHDYLYAGSLWVGGIVGTDTLVSAAINGNSGTSPQFSGFDSMTASLDPIRGHQQFACEYFDTGTSSPEFVEDGHSSLGLKIEQVSHAWQSAPYDRFIIIEYTVKNISADTIHQTRIGLFADADIYARLSVLPEPGYSDDLAGYLRDPGVAYCIDNDGDPDRDSARSWESSSIRGAIGIAPILVDPPSCCTTFNWWTAFGAYFDWSPSHANSVCWQCPSAVPPLRDVQKYYIMHNGEIDYDQMWSTVDFSSDGWKPPLPQSLATNIAKGIDTRYLLAFGQWDLAPGDSIRFVAALVAGDSVHQSPGDFAQYFDPLNPSAFYHRLDFRDLIDQTTRARTLYLSGFDLTGASPAQIHATVTGDRTVKCRWTPAPFHGATGYRLYRRSLDDSGWTLLATLESDERGWEDSSLEIARTYQYSVSALYSHGLETPKSHFAAVTPGYPPIKPQIEAVAGSDEVTINWVVPRPGPTFSPPKYLDIFRHAEFDTGSVLVHRVVFPADSGETTSRAHDPAAIVKSASSRRVLPDLLPRSLGFIDHNVVSGTEYHYTATMTNRLDLESQRADEKSAMPMAFDRRGIMIIHYLGGLHRTELDTTIGLYVDWARFQRLDTIVFAPTPYPSRVYDECSLQRLSHYRLVVIASDVTEGVTPVRPLTDWLSKYLAAGGRCVFITRNLSSPDAMGGIPRHVLGIERTYHENGVYFVPDSSFSHDLHPLHVLFASTQFRGAQAHSASYPDLTVDSARVFNDAVIYSAQLLHLPIYGGGYLTEVGALDSLEAGTEVLYTYEAGVPDTSSLQGLPVAVKRVSDAGQAIMFNFPLWAMADHEAAWHTLSVAAADLGFDTLTAESASTNEVSAMLHWLYGRGSTVPDPLWDVNHDGTVDLLDAIRRIDRLRCPAK